jgi:hypothetical protein
MGGNVMDFTIFIPLPSWRVRREMQILPDVLIRHTPAGIGDDLVPWSHYFSGRQIEALRSSKFSLQHKFMDAPAKESDAKRIAKESIINAFLAYQVVLPAGTHETGGFVILCRRNLSGLEPSSAAVLPPMFPTPWGKKMSVRAEVNRKEISSVASGIQQASHAKTSRLLNALQLLKLGFQASDMLIRTLIWVTALDGLVLAGNGRAFVSRLKRFLGGTTSVFPVLPGLGHPKYMVGEVVEDLYEIRNHIAHGRALEGRFEEPVSSCTSNSQLLHRDGTRYKYYEVLHECALFLLCMTVREICSRKLVETISDTKRWRTHLIGREGSQTRGNTVPQESTTIPDGVSAG